VIKDYLLLILLEILARFVEKGTGGGMLEGYKVKDNAIYHGWFHPESFPNIVSSN